jgi:hypothetical protein
VATDLVCLAALRTLVAVFDRRGILYALIGGTAVQFVYGVAFHLGYQLAAIPTQRDKAIDVHLQ